MTSSLRRAGAAAWAAGAVLVLSACAGGPDKPRPKPLPVLTSASVADAAWNQRIGPVRFPLTVAVTPGAFTVASSDGIVVSLESAGGRERWRANLAAPIGAGVGSDGQLAAVVMQSGDLVVLRDGKVLFRKALGTRVVTAPLVAGERVFVLGVDRTVQAFDALDGRRLWRLQRPGDPLALAQVGVLSAFRNTLIVGQGPRLAGVDPLTGAVQWESAVGTPRGANEVERLADLIGPPARVGSLMCARAFQVAVGCVDAERGGLTWSRPVGGNDAIAADANFVYGADGTDRLSAWRSDTGNVAWTSDVLMHRGLGAPAVQADSVVYADASGMLHWLRRQDGQALQRLATDGSPPAAPPAVAGPTLLLVTRAGGLHAFRAR